MKKGHNYGLCKKCRQNHGPHPKGMLGKRQHFKNPKERALKISQSLKGKPKSKEHIEKINQTRKRLFKEGKLISPMKRPEVRTKFMGNRNPAKRPEVRKKISKNNAMNRPEIRKKISRLLKEHKLDGRLCPKCGLIHPDRTGKNNNFYGKHHTQETKRIQSERKEGIRGAKHNRWVKRIKNKCEFCNKDFFVKPHDRKRKFCSQKCWHKYFIGKKTYLWIDGRSYKPPRYPREFYILHHIVKKICNYCCVFCNKKENGHSFPIHHIDYNKQNSDIKNLILLCKSCHSKTGFNREYWIKTFQKIRGNLNEDIVYR